MLGGGWRGDGRLNVHKFQDISILHWSKHLFSFLKDYFLNDIIHVDFQF